MREGYLHLSDEELLLHAGGELPAGRSAEVFEHLGRCSPCRARRKELDHTLAEFGESYGNRCDADLAEAAGPRARLKARLAELATPKREPGLSSGWMALVQRRQAVVFAGIGAILCLLLAIGLDRQPGRLESAWASRTLSDEPDLRLTPGATVAVTASQVCGVGSAKTTPVIPISLERKVFELYGVSPARPDAYEVDYLITPELGGATDIRNLWPEPYQDTVWNAHVKDQLEERLHRMVCRGDMDLATAQRDISTDWIAAYRKYFHADRPVGAGSSSNSSQLDDSNPST
jgi:hypothetical protein